MSKSEKIILAILDELSGCFEDNTRVNVEELLLAGEPGVALEILCAQLAEFDIPVSRAMKAGLIAEAKSMGMKIDELEGLRVL